MYERFKISWVFKNHVDPESDYYPSLSQVSSELNMSYFWLTRFYFNGVGTKVSEEFQLQLDAAMVRMGRKEKILDVSLLFPRYSPDAHWITWEDGKYWLSTAKDAPKFVGQKFVHLEPPTEITHPFGTFPKTYGEYAAIYQYDYLSGLWIKLDMQFSALVPFKPFQYTQPIGLPAEVHPCEYVKQRGLTKEEYDARDKCYTHRTLCFKWRNNAKPGRVR